METCCATEECIYKSNDAAYGRHREVATRACEGWKLEWTDPGPEVTVVNSIVPGPFERPKILKALPYQVVSKCGHCVPRDRRKLRNGIPDPWLEYLEHEDWKSQEKDGELWMQRNAGLIKRCIKITDFVWHKKGIAMMQGIPDPWKSDLPCICKVKKKSNNKKYKSQDKTITRRRSSTRERESPRRRISTNEEGTTRRKSIHETESCGSTSANEEEPLRHRNAIGKEKSSSRTSPITKEFVRRHSSNKRGENKRRNKNYDERPIRRRSKSEENIVKCAICYAAKPSKTAYACYGGIFPACLSDYFVEHYKKRNKRYEEKAAKHEEVPTKRKHNKEEFTKSKSKSYEGEIIEDCLRSCEGLVDERRKKCHEESLIKSINKNKGTYEDSSELSVEALKKSRKRNDTAKHKVEKEKSSHSMKKLRACGSGFDKVKQRLQELENELKAKEAAKDLKLREMEQLSKLRRKACKGKKKSGKIRGKFDGPAESMGEVKSSWKEPTSPRRKEVELSVHTDRIIAKEVKDVRTTKSSTRCNKNVCRWLDEPGVHNKNLPKESSKSSKKTEAVRATSQNNGEFKTPKAPLKSICKTTRPVTVRPCSPRLTTFTRAQTKTLRSHSPCSSTPRRVSYTDEPKVTCASYSLNNRRVSYCDELQSPTARTSSPCSRKYQASYVNEPVTPRSNLSKSSHCTGTFSTISPKESKESVQKFLEKINSRIEITQDALNSTCMKSVAVQPYRDEPAKTWHCPGRDLCPRLRERAGGDEGPELFVRRVRVEVAANEVAGPIAKFNEKSVDDSEASDCNAGAEPPYLQPYRRCSMADFKRRQKEIEELFVESFSERDC